MVALLLMVGGEPGVHLSL